MGKGQEKELVQLLNADKDLTLNYNDLRKAVLTLRAINHKIRKSIIDMLEQNEKMTVTDIYIKLRIEQSVASQHLAILRREGIVETERTGKFIHYALNNERLLQINRLIESLAE
jgi:DNA-binding transcriptional ArsR family regulator